MVSAADPGHDGDMNAFADLRRSTGDAKLAGVCAAVGRRWQIDPLIVRIAAVVLALSSGVGIVLYAAAWLLMPHEGTNVRAIDSFFPAAKDWPSTVWLVLIIGGCIFTGSVLGSMMPFGIGPAIILAAMWYFGYYRRRGRTSTETAPPQVGPGLSTPFAGPATPFTEAAATWQQRVVEYRHQSGQESAPSDRAAAPGWPVQQPPREFQPGVREGAPHQEQPPPAPTASHPDQGYTRDPGYSFNAYLAQPDPVGLYQPPEAAKPAKKEVRPRARRRLGFVSLLVMGLALGGLGIADVYYPISPVAYVATALLVTGLTLILGTWFGRPKGLLALGIVLALCLGPTAGAADREPAPPTVTRYTQISELPSRDAYDVGPQVVDLSGLTVTENRTYEARVDVGNLQVRVPQNTNLKIEWAVDIGEARILDGRENASGIDLKKTTVANNATDPNAPQLTLILGVDVGQLEVTQ